MAQRVPAGDQSATVSYRVANTYPIQCSMDRLAMYIFTITPSHTDRPSQSINHVAPSSTDWPTHLQLGVQWIGWQCKYLPLLCLIPTGHPNPLTMLLHLVPTGQRISNWVFNELAGKLHVSLCLVPTGHLNP